jgi:hypothetical protein
MMEGIPDRFRIEALIILVRLDGFAYSLRYTAQATPKGTAKIVVINVSKVVPTIAGRIPPLVIPSEGNLFIKFHDTEGRPFEKISNKIIPRNRHTIIVLPVNKAQLKKYNTFFFMPGIFVIG